MLKIIGGTRNTTNLCKSCANGMYAKTMPESNDFIHCSVLNKIIQSNVVECRGYRLLEQNMNDAKILSQAVILSMDYQGNPTWTKNGRRYGKKKIARAISRRKAVPNPVSVIQ